MIWWHTLIYAHHVTWKPWGVMSNQAVCSCGKRWIK